MKKKKMSEANGKLGKPGRMKKGKERGQAAHEGERIREGKY